MAQPRNIAGPVVRGADFWGRTPEVNELWRQAHRGSVLLTGPRRYGKSSLMYSMLDEPQPGWSVLLTDVEAVASPAEFLTALTADLLTKDPVRKLFASAKALPKALRGWLAGIVDQVEVGVPHVGEVKIRLRERLTESTPWAELGEQVLGHLRELREDLLIIVDEFPMMIANFLEANEPLGIHFLKWFRTCRQKPGFERLRFLLGGSVNIEPRLERLQIESLLGDLQRFRVSGMPLERAETFVREVLEGEHALFEAGVPGECVRIARSGVHYYLQVLISEVTVHGARPLDHAASNEGAGAPDMYARQESTMKSWTEPRRWRSVA